MDVPPLHHLDFRPHWRVFGGVVVGGGVDMV